MKRTEELKLIDIDLTGFDAAAYVFHADTEGLNFRKAFKDEGFHLANVCIELNNP